MIDYKIIGSSSAGNSVLINGNILVDVGLPYKKIEPYMDAIKLVLITHIHQDHFKPSTVRRMSMEKPLIRFACGRWMVKSLIDAGVVKSRIDPLDDGMHYGYHCNGCDFGFIPIALHHDVPCFGYKFDFPNGKVFYATDTGNLNGIVARNFDLYLLEANYEDEEIKARMDEKKVRGEYAYEQRSLKYHLSKAQCDDFIARNAGPQSEFVYLHCHVDRDSNYRGSEPLTEWEKDESKDN